LEVPTAEILSLSQNRESAQKRVKRRRKAQKGDLMSEKGACMAPKGVNRRILAPFDARFKISKLFKIVFLSMPKPLKKLIYKLIIQ